MKFEMTNNSTKRFVHVDSVQMMNHISSVQNAENRYENRFWRRMAHTS